MPRLDPTPKYDQESKERARYARNLADLLWRKACNNLPAETKELLFHYARIQGIVATVIPEDLERMNYSFDHIADVTERAEELLIGAPAIPSLEGLPWDKFESLADSTDEQADGR